jgi:membrane protein DedA with SNARE-associated domain
MESITYFGILAGAFLEGELAYFGVLEAVRRGIFPLREAILVFFIGTYATDWGYYLVGKYLGTRFLAHRPKLMQRTQFLRGAVAKNPLFWLLTYRFIYGWRIVLPLLFGLGGISPWLFLVTSLLSVVCWLGVYGALFQQYAKGLEAHFQSGQAVWMVFVAILLLLGIRWLIRRWVLPGRAR